MKKIIFLFLALTFFDFSVLSQNFQNGSRWISASSGLRMRDAPNLSGKKLDVIPFGDRVNWLAENDATVYLAGTSGKWTKVKWEETIGWVYGGFLSNMHPDLATFKTDDLSTFYANKWDKDLSLCRIELDGYGFTLNKEGGINPGDYEYDITKSFLYEKGISVSINEGYEWGSNGYEFDTDLYSVEEVFNLACTIYASKYSKYLTSQDGTLLLPNKNENREPRPEEDIYGSYQSLLEEGEFKSFRIEIEEGCVTWWHFEILDGKIRFGDGGGC